MVEIESLEENNWIHANLVYQHFRWNICKTMLIIRIEIHVSIWRGGNLLAYLKLNSVKTILIYKRSHCNERTLMFIYICIMQMKKKLIKKFRILHPIAKI